MRIDSSPTAPSGWDDYVMRHPLATAYHRAQAVSIGAMAFRLRTTYLTAFDDKTIVGILPLVEQSSRLFGRYLVSLPFMTYGGVLADSTEISAALATRASVEAQARGADHVELRHSATMPEVRFAERLDKVSMILPLPESESALSKQIGAKLRSQIKRGDREKLELVWGGSELIPDFYRVFAPAMHALGTPVYPRRFFEVVYDALRGVSEILIVRMQGRPHAVAFLVNHGATMEVPWAVASPEAKHASVNMRMYWELLTRSIQKGVAAFDFGRSTVDSGTYRFKAQWGAEPHQLHWHYWLPAGAAVPKLNQSNPKYARAAEIWRRMPLWCANTLGPYIIRNLP
jgi:FemAB-related protein (PEP-CTERM system-associated)